MRLLNSKFSMLLLAGAVAFSACNNDDDEGTSTMTVNSITTTDGTNLYGATAAGDVALDQNILIGFSAPVNSATLGNVGLWTGGSEVNTTVTSSGSTVTITPTDDLFGGSLYTVRVEGVQSTGGATASTVEANFTTTGIGLGTAPASTNQTLYLQFNGSITDVTGNATVVSQNISYATDRFGNADGAAYFNGAPTGPGSGEIVELAGDHFLHPSTTISFWFEVNHNDYPMGQNRFVYGTGVERGYFLEFGNNLDWIKPATSHVVSPDPAGHQFATAWGDVNGSGAVGGNILVNYEGQVSNVITSNTWHHFVMSFDASTSMKSIYINGNLITQFDLNNNEEPGAEYNMTAMAYNTNAGGSPVAGLVKNLVLGFAASPGNTATGWADYSNATNTYKGAMDDFRIWNVGLTSAQVVTLYDAEK